MRNIRSQLIKRARRNRECYSCGRKIRTGEEYINREIRYDGKIITISFCMSESCNPKLLTKGGRE